VPAIQFLEDLGANGPEFFGVARCRSGIAKRNSRFISGVRVGGLGSQALQNGLKSPILHAMFVVVYFANFLTNWHDFLLHVRSHSALQHSRKKISISTSGFGSVPKDYKLPPQIFSANWRPMITKPSVHVDPTASGPRKWRICCQCDVLVPSATPVRLRSRWVSVCFVIDRFAQSECFLSLRVYIWINLR